MSEDRTNGGRDEVHDVVDAEVIDEVIDEPGDSGAGTDRPDVYLRRESFDVPGRLDIDVAIASGRVVIELGEQRGVSVEVRYDASAESGWMQGLTSMLNWFGGQFGDAADEDAKAAAVRETRVAVVGQRLIVHAPKWRRLVPLGVVVRAPAGSHLMVNAGSADIRITGGAGRVKLATGSGTVTLDRADGQTEINSGSGAIRLGPMLGGLRVRSGSGEIEVSSVGGATTLVTGTGDVWLGAVQHNVMARTGSGDLTIADAASGNVELITGSGEIRVGVRSGVAAQVDLRSHSGQARSELDLSDRAPVEEAKLRVRARTGSGNAVVSAAIG